jgi:hypothetical protein
MITRDEWNRAADFAAAAKYGQDHSGWLTFRRVYAVPTAVLAALGAIGFGAFLLWTKVVHPLFSGASLPAGPGTAAPVIAAVLLVVTLIAFRPRAMPTMFHIFVIKVIVLGGAWLALIGWTIGRIT